MSVEDERAVNHAHAENELCASCGSRLARSYDAPGGAVSLCAACAALNDLGCP